jgi:hypothetical protein
MRDTRGHGRIAWAKPTYAPLQKEPPGRESAVLFKKEKGFTTLFWAHLDRDRGKPVGPRPGNIIHGEAGQEIL